MARRYSQIKRGLEYETGLNNYVLYLQNTDDRQSKRMVGGTRGSRRETVPAAVLPFGKEMATGEHVLTRISVEAQQGIGSALTGRLYTQGVQLAGGIKLQGFRPAKISAFRGPGTATYVQSKVTKLYYLKYDGDSYGAPFGATSDTEEEFAGGTAVKNAILTLFASSDIKRASITPEKVPV